MAVTGTARRRGAAELACDLLDRRSVGAAVAESAPDAVVNLAGAASVAASLHDPAPTFEANATGVVNLLDAVARHVPRAHVLCVSSGDVYGTPEEADLPLAETAPVLPLTPYGSSKAAMEIVCEQHRRSAGLRIAIIRAFNHTGPGQSDAFAASSFARQVAEAEHAGRDAVELRTGDLELRRDFSDVRDIVRAYVAVVERELTGTFNACSERAVRIGELVEHLERATPLELRVEADPDRIRPGEPPEVYGSAERLRSATGWRPRIPLSETMSDLLDWWRERISG